MKRAILKGIVILECIMCIYCALIISQNCIDASDAFSMELAYCGLDENKTYSYRLEIRDKNSKEILTTPDGIELKREGEFIPEPQRHPLYNVLLVKFESGKSLVEQKQNDCEIYWAIYFKEKLIIDITEQKRT